MQSRLITLGIILIWMTHKLSYNEAVLFKFTNVVCESFNKSWIVVNNCRLRAINRNKTVFNLNATLQNPCSNIFADVQVFKRANGYKPWLMKFNVNVCEFHRKSYNPTAILFYNQFKEFSNLNHTCPYKGDQIVKGLYIRPEILRLPLPTGNYLITGDFILDNQKQLNIKLYFAFEEDL